MGEGARLVPPVLTGQAPGADGEGQREVLDGGAGPAGEGVGPDEAVLGAELALRITPDPLHRVPQRAVGEPGQQVVDVQPEGADAGAVDDGQGQCRLHHRGADDGVDPGLGDRLPDERRAQQLPQVGAGAVPHVVDEQLAVGVEGEGDVPDGEEPLDAGLGGGEPRRVVGEDPVGLGAHQGRWLAGCGRCRGDHAPDRGLREPDVGFEPGAGGGGQGVAEHTAEDGRGVVEVLAQEDVERPAPRGPSGLEGMGERRRDGAEHADPDGGGDQVRLRHEGVDGGLVGGVGGGDVRDDLPENTGVRHGLVDVGAVFAQPFDEAGGDVEEGHVPSGGAEELADETASDVAGSEGDEERHVRPPGVRWPGGGAGVSSPPPRRRSGWPGGGGHGA